MELLKLLLRIFKIKSLDWFKNRLDSEIGKISELWDIAN